MSHHPSATESESKSSEQIAAEQRCRTLVEYARGGLKRTVGAGRDKWRSPQAVGPPQQVFATNPPAVAWSTDVAKLVVRWRRSKIFEILLKGREGRGRIVGEIPAEKCRFRSTRCRQAKQARNDRETTQVSSPEKKIHQPIQRLRKTTEPSRRNTARFGKIFDRPYNPDNRQNPKNPKMLPGLPGIRGGE